jgi:hypothetical protein
LQKNTPVGMAFREMSQSVAQQMAIMNAQGVEEVGS